MVNGKIGELTEVVMSSLRDTSKYESMYEK